MLSPGRMRKLIVAVAWLGSTLGWRTIAVGTTGAGGRSVFALDVTDPATMTAGDVLWRRSKLGLRLSAEQAAAVAAAMESRRRNAAPLQASAGGRP